MRLFVSLGTKYKNIYDFILTILSNKMRTDLMNKRDSEAVKSYKILCELSFAMSTAPCKHLISYITRVINYWHCVLEQFYSE